MALKVILFDLDGTLLPMDQDLFTKSYFKLLAARLAPYGYEPKALVDAIWKGTEAMVRNDGSRTNEEAFWIRFSELCGERAKNDMPVFEEFYHTDFQKLKDICGFNPEAASAVARCKAAGYRLALATNPLFPRIATQSRIIWAGLEPDDFEIYTTYENTGYCKPNPDYYLDMLSRMRVDASECIMVGNDVDEDMVAQKLGMQVFLITDCLINRKNADISGYDHGGFADMLSRLGI